MSEPITIYGFGDVDRSGKVRWLAHELGLDVREERVAFGDQHEKPYVDLNPLGQIPTAIFRGQTLIESTSACQLLAESFESPKLWVGRDEPERQKYLTWLAICGETLEGRLVECATSKAGILAPEYFTLHEKRIRPKLEVVAKMLPKDGFVAGERFTVADVVAGYSLRLAVRLGLAARGSVEPYFSRLIDRPAATAARFFASLK
ncbi:MAG TPA: glutathione S-transferase family protein [Polyangiaceae bacterium]|jgi:glutathione S-transferase